MAKPESRRQEYTALLQAPEQAFRHDPQGSVELHVAVNAFNRTGVGPFTFRCSARQTAFNQVFLDTLVGGLQVGAFILPASRRQNLCFRHRLVLFPKAVRQGGSGKRLLCRRRK